jgi:hypothetical protein
LSLDSWVVFSIPKLKLELPYFYRFDPNNSVSIRNMEKAFQKTYDQLCSYENVDILFYGDYVRPPIKEVTPIYSMKEIQTLIKL